MGQKRGINDKVTASTSTSALLEDLGAFGGSSFGPGGRTICFRKLSSIVGSYSSIK